MSRSKSMPTNVRKRIETESLTAGAVVAEALIALYDMGVIPLGNSYVRQPERIAKRLAPAIAGALVFWFESDKKE
jgi:hypothetical protein